MTALINEDSLDGISSLSVIQSEYYIHLNYDFKTDCMARSAEVTQ